MSGKDANSYLVMLRMAEVLMEACPQAALGDFSKTGIWEGNLLSNVNICSLVNGHSNSCSLEAKVDFFNVVTIAVSEKMTRSP